MPVKIPSSVRILGKTYTIETTVDGLHPMLEGRALGKILPDTQRIVIYVGESIASENIFDALVHELKHAFDEAMHVKYTDTDHKEQEVTRFTTAYLLIKEALENAVYKEERD